MRKRIITVLSLMMAAVVFFSGCEALTFNSAENLVRPPKLSGDDGELQAAFEKAVSEKGEYILKYPSAGEYRSAFVRHDCDGDGNDEAFVFYSLKAEEMSVYMYMLDYNENEWIPVGDNPGEGNDVYSIEFCDLNSDGIDEVFVGWSSIDSKANKKLSVFCPDRTSRTLTYKILAIETYTAMYTVDLDFDGEKEILLALINSTSDAYTTEARLLKMAESGISDYKISAVGRVDLYSGITAINSIQSGLSGGRRYIYIDEAAENSYLTEMLYWDNSKNALATATIIDSVSIADCPTSRSLPLICKDVDKDSELEIPATTILPNSSIIGRKTQDIENLSLYENIYLISWRNFAEGDFTLARSYIKNEDDGFIIEYDEEMMTDWSIKFYPEDSISQFFRLEDAQYTKAAQDADNAENDAEATLLFTIKKITQDVSFSEEELLASNDEFRYIYEITEEGEEIGISKSTILSFFSLSED